MVVTLDMFVPSLKICLSAWPLDGKWGSPAYSCRGRALYSSIFIGRNVCSNQPLWEKRIRLLNLPVLVLFLGRIFSYQWITSYTKLSELQSHPGTLSWFYRWGNKGWEGLYNLPSVQQCKKTDLGLELQSRNFDKMSHFSKKSHFTPYRAFFFKITLPTAPDKSGSCTQPAQRVPSTGIRISHPQLTLIHKTVFRELHCPLGWSSALFYTSIL